MSDAPGPAGKVPPLGRILVVEDDRDTRELLRLWLTDDGYVIDESGSAEDALEVAGQARHDLALVDVMLPGIDGLALAPKLVPVPIVLMSVTDVEDLPGELEVAGFLSKPFSRAGLKRAVRQAVATS